METQLLILSKIIPEIAPFPNSQLPVLLYQKAFQKNDSVDSIELVLKKNKWKNLWRNGIFPFHHYHSNTHEVLICYEGWCDVQLGGDNGIEWPFEKGDALIIPAGVAHKNIKSSAAFKCIGAYPINIEYDMNYGKPEELSKAKKNIEKLALPSTDPVFGKNGPLFNYWK